MSFIFAKAQEGEEYLYSRLDPKATRELVLSNQRSFYYPKKLLELYSKLDYACLWTCKEENLELYKELVSNARQHGLRQKDYEVNPLEDPLLYELFITDRLIRLAYDLYYGRLRPKKLFNHWTAPEKEDKVINILADLIKAGRIKDFFKELSPKDPSYWLLVKEAELYEFLSGLEWKTIRPRKALRVGDKSPCIDEVRYRLFLLGDLKEYEPSEVFDERLKEAIKSFQERHGIEPTGILDGHTLKELNTKPSERLRQIYLNLEKLRWVEIPKNAIAVNIPSFELFYFKEGKLRLSSKVVVGRNYEKDFRPTPILYSRVQSITVNPKWYVPISIAVKDIKPKVLKDPNYLSRKGIRVFYKGEEVDPSQVDWASLSENNFPYMLVQEAGPRNALGVLKFNFPNPFAVYLHDTPDKHLFKRHKRTFSSGCIRVEKAKELALELLGPDWDMKRLNGLISSKNTITVRLPREVPIYLLYYTAFERDGKLHLREDIYGYDRIIGSRLFGGGS